MISFGITLWLTQKLDLWTCMSWIGLIVVSIFDTINYRHLHNSGLVIITISAILMTYMYKNYKPLVIVGMLGIVKYIVGLYALSYVEGSNIKDMNNRHWNIYVNGVSNNPKVTILLYKIRGILQWVSLATLSYVFV